MAKRINRPAPLRTETLECCQTTCPQCGGPTYQQYTKESSENNLTIPVILCLHFRRSRKEGKLYGRPTISSSVLLPMPDMSYPAT